MYVHVDAIKCLAIFGVGAERQRSGCDMQNCSDFSKLHKGISKGFCDVNIFNEVRDFQLLCLTGFCALYFIYLKQSR